MKWIYLSPHLDDAVFSCGGLIWEQTQSGQEVEIWTICAAVPSDSGYSDYAAALHEDWRIEGNVIQIRKEEDRRACQVLGAAPRYLSYLDCIYRKDSSGGFLYQREEDLFGGMNLGETHLISDLCEQLKNQLPREAQVVAPMGIGNHIDHDLVRKAVNRLERPLLYYADYPYARENEGQTILEHLLISPDWEDKTIPVSKTGIQKWQEASLQYSSQISTFWENEGILEDEIEFFSTSMGGVRLWKIVEND
jgi:LmbE family N-acetylglucosaminyl deacetylase